MDICFSLALASSVLLRSASPLTLAWQHSVEHFAIEEDWRADAHGLVLTEVRTRGLGAGVHVPHDARLVAGWWRFSTALPPQPQVRLANSRGAGYRVCQAGRCEVLAGGRSVVMAPCPTTMTACSSSNCWPPKATRGAAASR